MVHTLAGNDCAHIGSFEPVDVLEIARDLRALRSVLAQDRHLVLGHVAEVDQMSVYTYL